MNNKFIKGLGLILSMFPIYSFIAWVYVYSAHGQLTQAGKVAQFRSLFPDTIQDLNYISGLSIALALTSILMIGISKKPEKVGLVTTKAIYMSFIALILLFNIWSLL